MASEFPFGIFTLFLH